MRIISAPVVPFAINYSGRVAGHLNDERGRSRPVRGKRNRFKIVSSQKARAGAVVRWKNTEGNNSSRSKRCALVDGEIPRVRCHSLFGRA